MVADGAPVEYLQQVVEMVSGSRIGPIHARTLRCMKACGTLCEAPCPAGSSPSYALYLDHKSQSKPCRGLG